ncbi:LUD domain-containing protein [Halopenitus sp. POP-27]|uniref:LutC/YkgG family protein n=1 Tax=Halopenitus sp. POP-27 TaxID=2994425 RepID=UPI0024698713|nr:LUD domain-containing protein [Halopenitus sp. POP-27]
MSIETTFRESLSEHDVAVTRTTPGSCADAIADATDGKTIGVPLPEGLTLPPDVIDRPTNGDLETAETGVTPATLGIAETGSVHLESDRAGTELVSLYPQRHVAVLRTEDIVPDVATAIDRLGPDLRGGGSGVIATGPSATADMGSLVVGAHGPGEVHVVLVEAGR